MVEPVLVQSVHPISVLFPAPVDVSHELSMCFPGCGEFFVALLGSVLHVENLLFELDYLGLEARVVLPGSEAGAVKCLLT